MCARKSEHIGQTEREIHRHMVPTTFTFGGSNFTSNVTRTAEIGSWSGFNSTITTGIGRIKAGRQNVARFVFVPFGHHGEDGSSVLSDGRLNRVSVEPGPTYLYWRCSWLAAALYTSTGKGRLL